METIIVAKTKTICPKCLSATRNIKYHKCVNPCNDRMKNEAFIGDAMLRLAIVILMVSKGLNSSYTVSILNVILSANFQVAFIKTTNYADSFYDQFSVHTYSTYVEAMMFRHLMLLIQFVLYANDWIDNLSHSEAMD